MAGQYGVKETKEMLIGLVALGAVVADLLKDGPQIQDAISLGTKLMSDEGFKAKLAAAVEGAGQVPAEIKELDLADFLDLAKSLPEVLEAMKVA
jgi:hypothetical protein